MLLEPGPLALDEFPELDLEPDPPVFEALELETSRQASTLVDELGGQITQLWAEAERDVGAELIGELENAGVELDVQLADPIEIPDPAIAAAGDEATGFILETYGEIPQEAWMDLWRPWSPPTDVPEFEATTEVPLPEPEPDRPAPRLAAVMLVNLSRDGAIDWEPGEEWEIRVYGQPFAPVTVTAWKDGIDLGTETAGFSDADGNFLLRGSMGAEHIGRWTEMWQIGLEVASPMLDFEVLDIVTVRVALTPEQEAAPTPPGVLGTTPGSTGAALPREPGETREAIFQPAGTITAFPDGKIEWAARDVLGVQIRVVRGATEMFTTAEAPIGLMVVGAFETGVSWIFELYDFTGGVRGRLLASRTLLYPGIVLAPWVVQSSTFKWSAPPDRMRIFFETFQFPAGLLVVKVDGGETIEVIRGRLLLLDFDPAWRNHTLLFTLYSLLGTDETYTGDWWNVAVDLVDGRAVARWAPEVTSNLLLTLTGPPAIGGQVHTQLLTRELRWA